MQTEKTIYVLGFFDGVHQGHQALINACLLLAEKTGFQPGAIAFTTHPDGVTSGKAPGLLNTIEDRNRLLLAHGIHNLLEFPFNAEVVTTPWEEFLEQLLRKGAAGFVCGLDFRFGKGGAGTAEKLAAFCEERNIPYTVVPDLLVDNSRVSSTHIRSLLAQGNIAAVNRFLGHPHFITGTVVSGRGLGHTIGIPTANLSLPEELVMPKLGVYACKAVVEGKTYLAVTNIGSRPTVGGHQVRAESWLLDFDGDLYGKHMTLQFHAFLRPEKKFDSLEELKAEIEKNAAETRKIFENT